MSNTFKRLALAVILTNTLGVANAAFVNGDFSDNNVANGTFAKIIDVPSLAANGWDFKANTHTGISENTGAFSTLISNETVALLQVYSFTGGVTPELSQTFTDNSALFDISFDIASRDNPNDLDLEVSFNGSLLTNPASPLMTSNSSFTTYEFLNVAASGTGTNTLTFRGLNPDSSDVTIFLDNVNVSAVAAVPEPETYAMFLAGLGLLGFASRNKQA